MREIRVFGNPGSGTVPTSDGLGHYTWQSPSGGGGSGTGNVTDRGAWAASTAYNAHDLVEYGGTDFLCAVAHTSGAAFDTTKWTELSQFRGAWQANKVYEAGDTVVSGGLLYSANSNFTSGASFSAANWTLLSGAPLIENVETIAASGAAVTLADVTTDTLHLVTLTANCTFTFPAAAAGKSFTLALKQDATGGRTGTWPGTVKWSGGVAPTLTSTAAKTDVLAFVCFDGTNWLGFVSGLNF